MPDKKEIETCENCEFLKGLLEKEDAERRYLLDLLLTSKGVIGSNNELAESFANLPSINRFVTLSRIRREAEEKSKSKLANKTELTEAENKFQEELNRASKIG